MAKKENDRKEREEEQNIQIILANWKKKAKMKNLKTVQEPAQPSQSQSQKPLTKKRKGTDNGEERVAQNIL
jgi:hypothetical protein